MNTKEIGEIRRRQKRERSNMTAIYGCYVSDSKEIISEFKRSTGIMSENEADKYFALMRRVLGGARGDTLGKTLQDISFHTSQVADSPEHKLLMGLRGKGIEDDDTRLSFFKQVMENLSLDTSYLILLGTDTYDVPFKGKDGVTQADNSAETFTYVLCAICPVKQTKPVLHYEPESRNFQDGNIVNIASAPSLGFLFPAFDNRATNIYNALYFTRSPNNNYESFATAIFNVPVAKPAQEQKESFVELIADALGEDCNMEVVQTVHDQVRQQIALHKESKVSEALTISEKQLNDILEGCGVSKEHLEKFSENYERTFGKDAELYPENIFNSKKIEIKTPDVSIKVAADHSDLIQTRVLGGVKYILVQANEDVEVNGIRIHINENER